MSELKYLRINWLDLELAPELLGEDEYSPSGGAYFNRRTGQVLVVTDEDRSRWDLIEDELNETLDSDAAITTENIQETEEFQSLADWEQESALAYAMLQLEPEAFVEVPRTASREAFGYMEDFVETVEDSEVRRALSEALHQRRPFRRFRDVLAADRDLQRRWSLYEHARTRQALIDWLRSINVAPTNPEEKTYNPPPLPDLRGIMFAGTRRFVRFARDIPGVKRVALIGSLATNTKWPGSVDLLVTVADDVDLAPLSKLGRQLNGHMVKHHAGGEVYLVGSSGKCVGRTCPWRECGPGIRIRCMALNCGRREFLHDDEAAIRLDARLVADPPVVLWPAPHAAADVPPDVHVELVEPLRTEYLQES